MFYILLLEQNIFRKKQVIMISKLNIGNDDIEKNEIKAI